MRLLGDALSTSSSFDYLGLVILNHLGLVILDHLVILGRKAGDPCRGETSAVGTAAAV